MKFQIRRESGCELRYCAASHINYSNLFPYSLMIHSNGCRQPQGRMVLTGCMSMQYKAINVGDFYVACSNESICNFRDWTKLRPYIQFTAASNDDIP